MDKINFYIRDTKTDETPYVLRINNYIFYDEEWTETLIRRAGNENYYKIKDLSIEDMIAKCIFGYKKEWFRDGQYIYFESIKDMAWFRHMVDDMFLLDDYIITRRLCLQNNFEIDGLDGCFFLELDLAENLKYYESVAKENLDKMKKEDRDITDALFRAHSAILELKSQVEFIDGVIDYRGGRYYEKEED